MCLRELLRALGALHGGSTGQGTACTVEVCMAIHLCRLCREGEG